MGRTPYDIAIKYNFPNLARVIFVQLVYLFLLFSEIENNKDSNGNSIITNNLILCFIVKSKIFRFYNF